MAHLDQIMDIEPVAFGSHHWSRQSFVSELTNPSGNYFIAVEPTIDRLLGYTGFWLIGEEAHVTILAVHPQWRRQYIGERLLIKNICEAFRAGAKWLTLEVRVSNQAAQDLYMKYGFKNLGLRRNYYQDNDEDALVLWTENICSSEFIKLVKSCLEALFTTGACSKEEVDILLADKFFAQPEVMKDSSSTVETQNQC